jgi:tetratricopeptide (TPR) repeat protein
MEGRVLVEAFAERRPVESLPTWERGSEDRHARSYLSEDESKALLDQFVKLGYIDEISADSDLAVIETARENAWNLARACLYGGRFEEALPLLEDCHFAFPERSDHAQLLARCQLALGLLDEAEASAATALATAGTQGAARLIQAYIALEKGEKRRALDLLEQVRAEDPDAPMLLHYLSLAYLALRMWDEAGETARKIIASDPASVQGHLALTRCHLHRNRPADAIESALNAIAHDFSHPRGHFLLGTALFQSGDWENAGTALRRAIDLGRGLDAAPAHRILAIIANRSGDLEASTRHHLQARLVRQQTTNTDLATLARLRTEIAVRGEARLAARRSHREKYPPRRMASGESLEFLIVSGLPRSGTSLMMQILVAGGIEAMTDGLREADPDNPEGYYEWEEIKSLPRDPHLIERAHGKVTKVISAMLPHLPPHHRYKILFMTRPAGQIARSQHAMIRHRGEEAADPEKIEATLQAHAEHILSRLRALPNVDLLEIPFPELVENPDPWVRRIAEFLPGTFHASPGTTGTVKPALFRNT